MPLKRFGAACHCCLIEKVQFFGTLFRGTGLDFNHDQVALLGGIVRKGLCQGKTTTPEGCQVCGCELV